MAANWSLNEVLGQLDSGRKWTSGTISYSFPTTSGGLFSQGEAAGFRAVNSTQQALMVLAMATWDELIPQGFAPGTAGSTNIEFGYTSTSIGYAHAYFPTNGSIYFNATEDTLVSTGVGQYGFQTFIHEIGHSLGLNHMGNYNGNGNWTPSSYQDSVVLSVMSYFGPRSAAPNYSAEVMQADWVGIDQRIHSPRTPMVNDVMAIQSMYGTSTTTRTGDTTYGFNANAGGATGALYDFVANPNPVLTLFDSAGIDTLDLSGWTTPSRIDLRPGAFSSGGEMTNNIAIAYSTTIENAIGGASGDSITGNAAANRLVGNGGNDELSGLEGDDVLDGGAGNDTIDGGPGTDTAFFNGIFASFTISVSSGTVTLTSAGTGSDRVVGVERFQFNDGVRTLAELGGGGTTTTDTTAPVVTSLTPADNSTTVSPGANLVIGFNEPVKTGSGSVSIFNADGSLLRSIGVGDASQLTVAGSFVTINPSIDLPAGRGYYVTWTAGAFTDLAGNAHAGLTGNTSWNFNTTATSDTTPPQLLSLAPGDDATNVSAGANLVLQFNETVVAGSGNFVIRSGTQILRTIAVTDRSQVTINANTVTLDPASDLPAGAQISVTVDAGALRDASGNAYAGIATTTGWNFSVAAAAVIDDYPYSTATTGVVNVNGAGATGVIEVGGDRDLFRVQLTAGVAYSFTLQRTNGGLNDPLLTLWDPNLQQAAEDDDSAGAGNSRIGFTPTVSGTWYLGVSDYLITGTGAYTLSAAAVDAQPPLVVSRVPADDATQVPIGADLTLTFNEAVFAGSGRIRLLDGNGAVLREIGADSSAVRINGSTVTIDPGANLPAGITLAVNIDAGAFRDAAGNAFAGISGSTSWNFQTANVAQGDDYPMSVDTPGVVPVNGAAVIGRIDYIEDGDLFRVSLQAGVTYRFDLTSPLTSNVDPYLMLFGQLPEVDLIGTDDDSGPLPLDSRLYFTPSASGVFYLAAFDYSEAVGTYSLAAVTTPDDFLGAATTSGRVSIGSSGATGRIDVPSDIDMFAVTLSAGQQYSFELWSVGDSALADPYLALLDAAGNQLGADDDTGVNLESLLTFTAPSSGTYYLAAMDFDIGIGGYQLSGYVRNVIRGSAGNDGMNGTAGRDTLEGGAGNDTLRGSQGDDILQGDAGIDVGRYVGRVGNYFLEHMSGGGWVVSDQVGTEGRDLAYGVERLLFDDGYWAIDIDGHAGTTAKFLGAVFGRASVANEAYVGIGLTLLDSGMSDAALMQLALDARLGPGASAAAVVDLLWFNLVGSLPDATTRQFYVGLISSGAYTNVTLALAAAETDLNLENIDFVGLSEQGIPYVI